MAPRCRLLFLSISFILLNVIGAFSQSSLDDYLTAFEAKKIGQNTRLNSEHLLVLTDYHYSNSELKELGITPLRILDQNLLIIKSTDLNKLNVQSTFSINNNWKLSFNLINKSLNNRSLIVKTTDKLEASPFKKLGGNLYQVSASEIDLKKLIDNKDIYYIGLENLDPKVESRVLDMNLNPNRVNVVHNKYPELLGAGITVSIKEQLFNSDDLDLIGRSVVSGLESSEVNNHATEMATIIAGAGNTFITGKGVAPKAQITSSDFAEILPDENLSYQSLGITVQNHSYGTEIENFYGALAEAYDQNTVDNPTLVHVFSSGNGGQSVATEGTYANITGYANLTGNFKQSKNTISVGSVDTVNVHPIFVSNGPAFDGRIKPEVVAYSAVGASNSAALTSGIITLMQEAYFNLHSEYPESSLVKAILINEAEDVGAKGPDFKTGFGNVNALKSIESINNQQFFTGTVTNGGSVQHNLTIPSGAKNLKITLVWLDDVGVLNSNKALVNDLDLEVSDGSTSYLPWVLNTAASNLNAAAIRGVDRLNNVEQVTITNPVVGNYDINVSGFDISNTAVKYYIAYSWEVTDEFSWTFPTSSDNMPYNGESRSYFRWNTTYTGTGKLEYSLDNGLNWSLIADNVDLSDEYYTWLPTNLSGVAKARMTIGAAEYESDDFTLSERLNFEVKFNCGDSIMLAWDKDERAIGYSVYKFTSQNNFDLISNVNDTSIILDKTALNSSYLRIKPQYSTLQYAIGSESFDYELLNSGCYLTSFSGDAINDIIELRLEVSLDYGIDNIQFERIDENSNTQIDISSQSGLAYIAEDLTPADGINYYRGIINFSNGETLQTDTIAVFYLKNLKVYVYPNPLSSEEFLTVQIKDFNTAGVEFQLINRSGQLVYAQQLFGESNSVILPDISSGVYIYRIITPEGIISDRMVILRE